MTNTFPFLQAYLNALYRVQASPDFTMHINLPSAELAALYRTSGTRTAAFITACNPHSTRLTAEENRHRQQSLLVALQQLGLTWLPGRGEDARGEWPGEDSVLVLGIEQDTACGLGRQFGQNAIVFCGSDAIPQLLVL